jgi:cobalamin-independent methionine synthase catalytic subunit
VTNRATGIGSMPGTDFAEATRVVLGEVGDFPYLVELPDRCAIASMTGRTLAMLSGLAFDLQPAGWRLTASSGIDHRRAVSLLAQDLDTTEDLARERSGPFKTQVAGPWTLAATVERPRGDKVLADHGARRDLAQALAEGVRVHCADLRRRLSPAEVVVQIDEPGLPAVLNGAIPTASGFSRHRDVSPQDAAQSLTWVAQAAADSGATCVVHCCAEELPFEVLRSVPVQALSFDLSLLPRTGYDDLGGWLDLGRAVWLGVVPATDPGGPEQTATDLTRTVLQWWRAMGYSDPENLPDTTLTPTCGLAGASPSWAIAALGRCQEIARNLSVEQGRMEP